MGAYKNKPTPTSAPVGRYEDIHDAVLQTPRGRWFLEEFARRNRSADTDRILVELNRLQHTAVDTRSEFLRQELNELSNAIEQTRSEIAQIKPDGAPNAGRIIMAKGELDAIVTATERATSEILASAEHVQAVAAQLRAQGISVSVCDQLDAEANKILMACSFQDITGQRTTKVVNTLRYLEQRVNAMVQIWGPQSNSPAAMAAVDRYNPVDMRPDAELLHGPALEGHGVSQTEVDAFLQGADLPDRRSASIDMSSTADPVPGAAESPEPQSETVDQNAIDALFG